MLNRLKARQIVGGFDPGRQLNTGEIGVTEDGRWYGRDYRGAVTLLNTSTAKDAAPAVARSASVSSGPWRALSGIIRVVSGKPLGQSTTDHLPEGDENLYHTAARARAAVQPGGHVYAASAAGSDAYSITVSPAITSLAVGASFRFKADVGNSGVATLRVCGLPDPAAAILKCHDQPLDTGDIKAGQIVCVAWDGTAWQMQSQLALAGTMIYRGTADSGSGAAYTVTTTPSFTAYSDKLLILWTADMANSTPTPTLSCNGLAARYLTTENFTNLPVAAIKVGGIYLCAYDGTNNFWQIMTQIGV